MEVIATMLSLFVGCLALIRFYTKKSNTFLFIGAGFLGTAFLDGYHGIVTSEVFGAMFPSPPSALVPWSWVASRLFLSILMTCSYIAWKYEDQSKKQIVIPEKFVYATVTILTLMSFALFAFSPLPRAYYPELLFGRPEEFVPAAFFFIALLGYLKKGHWKYDSFEHWIVLSLIIGFLSQAIFMPFSFGLFDFQFDTAHLLKKTSYICVLIGLLLSMVHLFRSAELNKTELVSSNKETKKALEEAKAARKEAEKNALRIEAKILEAEEQKAAMLNIMDDLEQESQNTKKFQQAVEATTDAIAIATPSLELTYVNPAWTVITGIDEAKAIGKTPEMLIAKSVKKDIFKDMLHAAKEGQPFQTDELVYSRENGSDYNVELKMYPIESAGKIRMYVMIHSDITKRIRIDSAKSEFVSLASHQLRTPLTAIRWIFNMFSTGKAGELTDEQKELMLDAQKCTVHMNETIGTMLTMSRLETGNVRLEEGEVQLSSMLEEIKGEYTLTTVNKKQTLTVECADDVHFISDAKLLKESLVNLVSNAIKYTPEEGTISITARQDDNNIVIEVKDSGFGIPEHQKDKVFSKFFRAENIISKQTEGTGLGLYVVQSIVKILNGDITFVSEENKGTTFTITLPITHKEND